MKIITTFLIGAGLLATGGTAPAQTLTPVSASAPTAQAMDLEFNMMRKDLRDQKKQVIAANLPLNGDEAAKFWPLYDSYTQETIKLNDQRYGLIKEYAANYNSMTDAQASSYITRWIQVDEAFSKLRLDWVSKFEKLIGVKKSAIFFQIDRRVGLMIELQLSSQLPLVQP